jgi:hypothetical protein
MRFLWNVKLYEMANGYRVELSGMGKTVIGNGSTIMRAYRAADCQLIYHPPFIPCDDTDEVAESQGKTGEQK